MTTATQASTITRSSDGLYEKIGSRQTDKAESSQDRFLKLLVKQLQSQDPMNPMDNAQTTSQMAQINTVTGIEKLNKSMNDLLGSYSANQTFQAASMIGHGVLAEGGMMAFAEGHGSAAVLLDKPMANVKVKVFDAGGRLVDQEPLGAAKAGRLSIDWDGKLPDGSTAAAGNYRIEAVGITDDGTEIALKSLNYSKVTSISVTPEGSRLHLANGSEVSLNSIVQLN
ncbi:flagellar hook assembly protein FlgD [Parachitinimonas caeni]|uniref:Basal-body rod modification protein FlgD n=1 Tax=Parachitinimonas caeni TaxID=3031301 RepID=A0ABT7DUI7_9NEIS|nr:flagellar hook assembly protein FlgD [Parachitinimonas caeni]MDK2123741.1 flagellar hook assembly protein FlgD [Parachitinimonas caeni]